jgi:hypothetical protein
LHWNLYVHRKSIFHPGSADQERRSCNYKRKSNT